MPMKTTFFTARMRRASTTWARISMLVTCRIRPLLPVMQKRQPTAQPTWVETQSPSRGSSIAFHHLPVGQFDQQARAIVAGMLGSDAGQAVQLRRQGGHGVAQRQRQEVLGVAPPRALVQRLALQPDAHEPAAMHGQGIKGGETLVEVGVAHGERGGRRQMLVAWPVQSSELMSLQITRLDTKSLGTQCVSKAFCLEFGGAEEALPSKP